ncbi:MAG: SDR family NAD(P)-dependent oxidoreductase [Acidimicrobiales bacterium]
MVWPPQWRTALVTGASSGIGRAFALALARRGMDVVAVARRRDRLEELAAEIAETYGRSVEILPADLSEREGLAAVEARLADADRPVDVLVNGAGFGTSGKFVDSSVETEQQEIDVNVSALVRLTRAAVPPMVARGTGAVVNVSSIAGHQPLPWWATYAATKAYVTTFSRALAAELGGTGVRVLTLMPGFTRTEFHKHDQLTRELIPGPAWMTPDAVAESALGRLERGRTESIPGFHNRAIAYLSRMSPWPLTRLVLRLGTRKVW